jgi:hypothetical protein
MTGLFGSWVLRGLWQSDTDQLNQDIRDLDLVAGGRLYATSGAAGGVLALDGTTPGAVLDAQFHASQSLLRGQSALTGDQLLSSGAPLRGLEARALQGDGGLGAAQLDIALSQSARLLATEARHPAAAALAL